MSLDKLGDVQAAQGDLAGGAGGLPSVPGDRRAPGGRRPEQRRLAARPVGEPQQARRREGRPGDLDGALADFEQSLAIAERLADADPSNAGWQRDLSVSLNKLGDVQSAQGRPRRRAGGLRAVPGDRRAPGRRGPEQRRLAARPVGEPGQARRRAGRPGRSRRGAGGLPSSPWPSAERLADADPSNAGWQRDLSVSQNKLGDVQAAQGRSRRRAGGLRAGPGDRERLAAADPSNAGWQRDLSVSLDKLGDGCSPPRATSPAALAAYQAPWRSASAWPPPTRATPAGSATCR